MKIELKGESIFTTNSDMGSTSNDLDFFFSGSSVELTGAGSINSSTSGYLINAAGSVKLNGGTYGGRLKAASAVLNNITIPEDRAVYLEGVTGTVTTSNMVNNGTLVLKNGTSSDTIKGLNIAGRGYVKVMGAGTADIATYYANDGTPLHFSRPLDFSSPEGENNGNWSSNATVEENGYRFTGNSTSGYTLELGNLVIEYSEPQPGITLPGDGPVKVILTNGTTARIINNGGGRAILFTLSQEYPCTITGSGSLLLEAFGPDNLFSRQPLTIAGGNITIRNFGTSPVANGINTGDMPLTLSGGSISITTKRKAVNAGSLRLDGMQIASPAGAAFNADEKTVLDANGNPVSSMTIGRVRDNTSPVTVFNTITVPNATVWLAGSGLESDDLLVTKKNPKGSAYSALLKLADSDDVFATYNIYLRSGKKSTGSAMDITFNLNAKYSGRDFTLVHQKADGTYEYFYDTADANGDLTFGPLYELSPFMLVKGTLDPNAVSVPNTGNNAQPVLFAGAVLIMAAGLMTGLILLKRKKG